MISDANISMIQKQTKHLFTSSHESDMYINQVCINIYKQMSAFQVT